MATSDWYFDLSPSGLSEKCWSSVARGAESLAIPPQFLLSNVMFAVKKEKQNGLPRRWQTVLFLKDDIKGRYYSWRKVLFLFLVSAGSTDE